MYIRSYEPMMRCMPVAEGVKIAGTFDSDEVVKAMEGKLFHYEGVHLDLEYFDKFRNLWNSTYRKLYEEGRGIAWGWTLLQ